MPYLHTTFVVAFLNLVFVISMSLLTSANNFLLDLSRGDHVTSRKLIKTRSHVKNVKNFIFLLRTSPCSYYAGNVIFLFFLLSQERLTQTSSPLCYCFLIILIINYDNRFELSSNDVDAKKNHILLKEMF